MKEKFRRWWCDLWFLAGYHFTSGADEYTRELAHNFWEGLMRRD